MTCMIVGIYLCYNDHME